MVELSSQYVILTTFMQRSFAKEYDMRANPVFLLCLFFAFLLQGCRLSGAEEVSVRAPLGLCSSATANTAVWGTVRDWSDPESVLGWRGSDDLVEATAVTIAVESLIWGDVRLGDNSVFAWGAVGDDGSWAQGRAGGVMLLEMHGKPVSGVFFLEREKYWGAEGEREELHLRSIYRLDGERLIGVLDDYSVEEFLRLAVEINHSGGQMCLDSNPTAEQEQ